MPGRGEAELFALSPLELTIRVHAGILVRFDTDAAGHVTGTLLKEGRRELRARSG